MQFEAPIPLALLDHGFVSGGRVHSAVVHCTPLSPVALIIFWVEHAGLWTWGRLWWKNAGDLVGLLLLARAAEKKVNRRVLQGRG